MNTKLRILSWAILLLVSIIGTQLLRPRLDISWNTPLLFSSGEVEEKALSIFSDFGIVPEKDSLGLASNYVQDYAFVEAFGDSLGLTANTGLLQTLDESGQSAVRWDVSLFKKQGVNGQVFLAPSELYKVNGAAQVSFSPTGKVIRFRTNQNRVNAFVEGTKVEQVAEKILDSFGYDISSYDLLSSKVEDELGEETKVLEPTESERTQSSEPIALSWNNPNPKAGNPALIQMKLEPVLQTSEASDTLNVNAGFSLVLFNTIETLEANSDNGFTIQIILFVIASFLLLGLVFTGGLLSIIKNRVDWKQSLLVFLLVASALIFWRAQFVWQVGSQALEWGELFLSFVNSYFLAAVIALFSAVAYIGWNNLARDQKHPEFRLVTEFWNFRFMFKESGFAYVQGISIGFFLLLLTFLSLQAIDSFLVNFEGSNFGVSEPESFFPALTIGLSSWSVAWIAALGQYGLVTSLFRRWFKKAWIYIPLTLVLNVLCGVFFSRLFTTTNEIWFDFLAYTPIAFVLILTYQRYGIISLSVSLFVYNSLLNLLPFTHLEAPFSVTITPILYFATFFILFVFGMYLAIKGESIEEEVEQLPDYEIRFQTQARVVREIEVARQTQMQLMPDSPPKLDGVDLYGFFMPSFEVGGDYYYYYTLNELEQNILAFTMLDVSGKAMRAAIQAVFTSGLLMSRMSSDEPDDILDAIAPMVYEHTDSRTFITCLVGRYNADTRLLNYANAGHCLPLLKRGNKTEFLESEGPRFPLGMRKKVDYLAKKLTLEVGDVLLLYSDGFPEAEDRKRNRLGYEGIRVMFNELDTDALSAREIGEVLKKRIIAHSGQRLADDTTVIVMKIEA